jgi:hypothetical protein
MSTEDIYEISIFDRYLNPFEVKDGIDLNPDFKPDAHYLQLKSLCDEAVFRRNWGLFYIKQSKSLLLNFATIALRFN